MNTIILEGPDGAGKTTLARELEKLGYAYLHFDVPKQDEDIFAVRLTALLSVDKPSVIDRLHLSDRIYGLVMRVNSPITELQERLTERYLHARGGQVVICLPPWRTVLTNWLKNHENEYVDNPDKLRVIYHRYVDLFKDRPYDCFDYTKENVESYAHSLQTRQNNKLPK